MYGLLEVRPPWKPLVVKKSSLNVHQLVIDNAHCILITFNINPALGQLDVVVEVNAGLSEVINSFL